MSQALDVLADELEKSEIKMYREEPKGHVVKKYSTKDGGTAEVVKNEKGFRVWYQGKELGEPFHSQSAAEKHARQLVGLAEEQTEESVNKPIDNMVAEMDKLAERFLNVDRSGQVDAMGDHLEKHDQGADAIDSKTPAPDVAAAGAAPAKPVDPKAPAAAGSGPSKKEEPGPEAEAYEDTTIVPTISGAVSNAAASAGMLIRALQGLDPKMVTKTFGEACGDKMKEWAESMDKCAEYFKPKKGQAEATESVVIDEKFRVGDVVVRDMKPGEEEKHGTIHLVNPTMKDIATAVESAKQSGHKTVLVQHIKTAGGKIKEA